MSLRILLINTRFLLAQLHLNSLKGKRAPTAVRDALKKLPTGTESYDRAYSDAMERIEGQLSDEEALAKEALSWITCAKRPLTTTELQYALAIKVGQAEFDEGNKPDIEDIVSVCAGLVTIDEESGIIRLVHYTTQKYFERRQKHWFPTVDFDITAICVTYLSFTVFRSGICLTDSSFEERLQRNPLYDYAANYWGRHACQIQSPHLKIVDLIVDFLQHKMNVEAATQAMLVRKLHPWQSDYSQAFPRQITGLHLSANFGITEVAAILLDCADPNSKDTNDQTPLSWAARNGHEGVVKLLLNTGKVDVDSKVTKYSQTPLSWAARNGHESVVKLLLSTGKVDVDSKDTEYGQTPLLWAFKHGRKGTFKLLFNTSEVDVDSEDDAVYSRTPLLWAATNGHEGVVKLLLNTSKVDVSLKDTKYGQTPLWWAARNGHEGVVKLLLDTGKFDVDLKDDTVYSRTLLLWAATNGHEGVVKLLLNTGKVNVNLKDRTDQTPLSLAATNGHEGVVKLLLNTGKVDVNLKDSSDQTSLSWAARNGHEGVVKLLLDTGKVDVDSKDDTEYGQTPLSWAAENGHEGVVKLLLNTGKVDVNFKDKSDQTPLLWAAKNGHEGVVRLLQSTISNVL
jgi:ankyrin repeat protein